MKLWILILACCALLCTYIGFELGVASSQRIVVKPQPRLMSIIELQEGLVEAGYDIGPCGIDGRLADCNTVQAWKRYEIDVLHNEYAAQFMTPSGGKE